MGKTTTVSNLGAILANDFNKKVLIVDANFSAPNLGLHLGMVNPQVTLHDVIKGRASIKNAIYNYYGNLDVLPGSLISSKINPYLLKKKLENIKKEYDIILLDSSPNLNKEILSTMIASDELLVVSTPDFPTLSTTMNAVKVAKKQKTPITGIILNKIKHRNFELGIDDIEEAIEVPIIAALPDDISILESIAHTTPAALYKPGSHTVIEYKKLASALLGEEYHSPGLREKIKNYLSKKVPKQEINRRIMRKERS